MNSKKFTIVETANGRIITADADSFTPVGEGRVIFDPAVSVYDARRKMVFKKTPDLSHTLPVRFEELCRKVAAMEEEIRLLKETPASRK